MTARVVRASLLVVGALVALGSPAAAALVRVEFSGSVNGITGQIHQYATPPIPISPEEAEAALGGSVRLGTSFSGFFVYDDESTPYQTGPHSAYYASALWPGLPDFAAGGEIGAFARGGGSGFVQISDGDDYESSIYVSGSLGSPPAHDEAIALTVVTLYVLGGSAGSPLDGTSLHSIPWASFPRAGAQFVFQQGDLQVNATGIVTRLVPEPASVGLAALAACSVLAARRRTSNA